MRPYCILPAPHPLDEFITQDVLVRFFSFVALTESCWLWLGAQTSRGYGVFTIHGENYLAHRLAYHLAHGPIPPGLFVCHNCPGGDTPACVRADHMFLGTAEENMADLVRKGGRARGEAHHKAKLSDDDVREIRTLAAQGVAVSDLMRRYHMDRSTLWDILHGKRWSHVGGPLQPARYVKGADRPAKERHGPAKGERHGGAKLTADQVREIRRRYAAGGITQTDLAREFGVTNGTVFFIIRRRLWADLED